MVKNKKKFDKVDCIFISNNYLWMCSIISNIQKKDISNYTIYQSFFSIWSACIIPIGVGIITGYLIYEENLSNSFNIILSNGIIEKNFTWRNFYFQLLHKLCVHF